MFVIPTLTVKVFVVFDIIARVALCAGSPPDELGVGPERGYACVVAKLSCAHLNTNEFVASPTVLLVVKPWDDFVITKFPVAGSYVAFVGVRGEPPVTVTALVAALTNTWVLEVTAAETIAPEPDPDKSVTATETGFLYPEPNDRSFKYSNAVPDPTYVWVWLLVPTFTEKVLADAIPVIPNDVLIPIARLGVNVKPSNLTNSFISPKSWSTEVVISNSPEILLYDAVLIL